MKIVTYNIQYGIGLDGEFGMERIADAVRGADVIALQEVSRNNPRNGGVDMVAGLCDLLPDHFSVFGAPYLVDMGSRLEGGRAVTRFFEFGNMVLSRTPILSARNHLLPRRRSFGALNLQRGALEAMIDTGFGPMRVYSVHLDHTSPDERIEQIRFLRERAVLYPLEGGAVSGVDEFGFPEPPHPDAFVLAGDFNMLPESPEYLAMAGMLDDEHGRVPRAGVPVDAALYVKSAAATAITWRDPKAPEDTDRQKRIDYTFVSAGLVRRVKDARVDLDAPGSDHVPVWLHLG